jgi:hypothetical protein
MPIVLSTATATKSGHTYDDRTGESYEYPAVYRTLIQPGVQFIYYRSGEDARFYFGSGVIGEAGVPTASGHYRCEILDYSPFATPVPLKIGDDYFEYVRDGHPNFRQGVREIDQARFEGILLQADALATTPVPQPRFESEPGTTRQRRAVERRARAAVSYASREVREAVDNYAMATVLTALSNRYPNMQYEAMPQNNPGFDVLLGAADAPTRYVEVKGTQASEPQFFLSEGERRYSIDHGDNYTIAVVYGIDLEGPTHVDVLWRDGPLIGDDLAFRPRQWHVAIT